MRFRPKIVSLVSAASLFVIAAALVSFSELDLAYIDNSSGESLGYVSVAGTNSNTAGAIINANGTYAVSLGSAIEAVSIAGTTLSRPDPGPILLPSGAQVWVRWVSGNWIECVGKLSVDGRFASLNSTQPKPQFSF